MPILQNLNQVTVRVTNYPGPLIAQHKRAQARNQAPAKKRKEIINQIQNRNKSNTTNQTNQALRYIPLKAETNLPCVAAALHHAAENSTPFNPIPQTTDS
jgi:hypothetical protein